MLCLCWLQLLPILSTLTAIVTHSWTGLYVLAAVLLWLITPHHVAHVRCPLLCVVEALFCHSVLLFPLTCTQHA